MISLNKKKICVVGLGYVGLPLLIAFSKKNKVIGFDINNYRINDLLKGNDTNREFNKSDLINKNIKFTNDINDINECNIFIITIPTPIFKNNEPNLNPLKKSIESISKIIKKNCLIIIESTVYPGVTENVLARIIEKNTKYILNKDYYLGYSPERVNPGDKIRRIQNIQKVVSGSNQRITNLVHNLYSEIITAGVFRAKNIKTAEASKVIENVQRDLNIALVNDLSKMFKKNNINIFEVLDASSTKWNFHTYSPGLVGGHCIGVDPYYLTYWSKKIGHKSNFILSGRKVNESMVGYTVKMVIKTLTKKKISLKDASVLILGITFKENCNDIRNSKSLSVVEKLNRILGQVHIFDPFFKKSSIPKNLSHLKFVQLNNKTKKYDSLIILTPHKEIIKLGYKKLKNLTKKNSAIIDIKNSLKDNRVDFTF